MSTLKHQLLAELRPYRPADATEARHHRAILEHLIQAEAPLSRAAFRPGHITASLFIVDPAGTRVLLHHDRRCAKGEPEHLHYDVRYVARTARPEAIAMDVAESRDLAWMALARAVELKNEEASTRAIAKIRALLGR